MQIVHLSNKVVESNQASGTFIKTLIEVTNTKKEAIDKADSTKTTYDIRLGQVMKYILYNNLQACGPEIWDENRVHHFKTCMIGKLEYSPDVVRRAQDLVFDTLEQCRREGYTGTIPRKEQFKRTSKPPVFCTPEEIDLLMNHKFASDRLSKIRDLFLIQCFSGVSYCDLPRLRIQRLTHIDGIPVIQDLRQKAKVKPFTIPLIPELRTLMEKYKWKLPIISNGKYNSYLKEVAEITGIDKPLRTHDGRRTCGMYYLRMTGNMSIPAAVLGHSDESITRKHYAPYLPMHLIQVLKNSNIFATAV